MSLFTRGTELQRFRKGTMPKVALVVLLVIPLIYGALYLWAFWAPTDHMDRLPVAVVNLDEPATTPAGDALAAGDDVVTELQERKDLGWKPMTESAAATAVSDGEVYFSVTIPRDFSATLAGLQDEPRAGTLEVTYNDNNSFLASTLGKTAMVQLRDAVAQTATQTAAEQVLVGVEKLSAGTRDAADAAGTLDAGTSAVAAGSTKLSVGLGELAAGTAQIVAKAPELTSGTAQLATGLGAARDGSAALAEGGSQLASGASAAAGKTGELRDGLGQLSTGADSLATGTATVATGSGKLAAGADKLATGAATVSEGMAALQTGTAQLATGSGTLSTGATALSDGAAALSGGATALNTGAAGVSTGAAELSGGAAQLASGTGAIAQFFAANSDASVAELDAALQANGSSIAGLAAGAAQLSDAGAQLATGAGSVATGAADLDAGLQTLTGKAGELAAGAGDVAASSVTLRDSTVALAQGSNTISAQLGTLRDSASELSTGAATVSAGAGTLSEKTATARDGSGQLAAGLGTLATGAQDAATGSAALAGGVATAADGADRLAAGADQLAAGATQLDTGAQEASAKSGDLAKGATQVSAGADTFATKLAEGADEAPEFAAGQSVKIAETMAAPVALDESTENAVQGFGGGFAPFFIALASFVGALITWLILRPLPRRPLASNVSGLRSVLAGFWPAALIGLGQVVIMMLVLVYGIGLEPAHWLGMTGFMLLVTLAFLALQQMFIAVLGTAAGRVVSLVLLMLQLSSSGGTYPVETTPAFFQILHPFMPASYVVDGLRQLIGGGIDARFWVALAVMLAVLLGSLAISSVAARRQKVWTLSRLHPELAI
ncbi:YhgE/Pip domain-containing protein [Leucobacter luti]|uniref:Putative membrane protein n=1 Tax=Leucobacter luti TaxID=340320 RepID=A0A4Q7TSJ3_9MICO|nr:YhgE/Pip domain-containing protein [Leucobacter luti]MBL3699791.1 YhgE/Pip domain-containing protein [Leucobacter luti]RZT62890.1 putative membrane protein [Leucobacter luti]